jgi:thiamine transport system permease protein
LTDTGERRTRARRPAHLLLAGIPLAYLAVFYFYPLASMLGLSLAPEGQFDLAVLARLLDHVDTLWFTTWQAGLSTLITLILGLPGAYVLAKYVFPGKSLLQALITIPFVLPTVVVSSAFTALLGPNGQLNQYLMGLLNLGRPPIALQGTLAAILLAHVFYNVSLVVRIVGTHWANLDPTLVEAAQTLGMSRWRAFREVTLPLLAPSLGAAAVMVFVFCFTSFGVMLILGDGHFVTLEVEIYFRTIGLPDLPLAAALALVQILITFALLYAYTGLQSRLSVPQLLRSRQTTQRRPSTPGEWALAIGSLLPIMLLLITPLMSLAERSLTVGGATGLTHYRALFTNPDSSVSYVPPITAVRNSSILALATVMLALALGTMVAITTTGGGRSNPGPNVIRLTRLLDPLFMIPLGTSAVTLGLGYIVALDEPPLNLRTSPLLIVLAHTLVALPFVVRSLLPTLRSIHPRLRESATLLGASPWQVWRQIDLPMMARSLGVGAVFAFTVSMGEFGATALIARPRLPTMPLAIYRLLGQPGVTNYGQALAMSTLLMLVCAIGFLAIERSAVGEF